MNDSFQTPHVQSELVDSQWVIYDPTHEEDGLQPLVNRYLVHKGV